MKTKVLSILANCALILSGTDDGDCVCFRMTGEGMSRLFDLGLVGKGDTFGGSGPTLEYFQELEASLPQADYRYEGNVNFGESECEVYLSGFCMKLTNGNFKQNTILLAASIIGEKQPDEVGMSSEWLRLWWD
jgi:hypothetical protein